MIVRILMCFAAAGILTLGPAGPSGVFGQENPVPDIQVNGSDGPVVLTAGDAANVTVSLDPGGYAGTMAEWWVAATTPFPDPWNYASYIYPQTWTAGIHPCVAAPLFSLMTPFTVLQMTLPAGSYGFYFVLDTVVNGVPEFTWWDYANLEVLESPVSLLPDTGQHTCYGWNAEIPCPDPGEEFYGQDAQYQGPEPSYVDNGNGTVTDSNTALTWQQGDEQNAEHGWLWDEACAYCETLELAGHGDWALPEIEELATLPIYGTSYPAVDTEYFPNCRSDEYWSRSVSAEIPNEAWSVDFRNGAVYSPPKTCYLHVRCVRHGNAAVLGHSTRSARDGEGTRFVDNNNGTVTDTLLGGMWEKSGMRNRNLPEALDYCESLELGGYTDWRLPNARELGAIVDRDRYAPAIDPVFECEEGAHAWTSTTVPYNPGVAWAVYFWGGHLMANTKNWDRWARCVRSGPLDPLGK